MISGKAIKAVIGVASLVGFVASFIGDWAKEKQEDEKFNQDNVEYVQIAFGYHSARSWRVAFYDSLQRFFK